MKQLLVGFCNNSTWSGWHTSAFWQLTRKQRRRSLKALSNNCKSETWRGFVLKNTVMHGNQNAAKRRKLQWNDGTGNKLQLVSPPTNSSVNLRCPSKHNANRFTVFWRTLWTSNNQTWNFFISFIFQLLLKKQIRCSWYCVLI